MNYKIIRETDINEDIVEVVFQNRGIDPQFISQFINPTEDVKTNPFDYTNMELAIRTFIKHFDNDNKAILLVDSDVDGYMSAAMVRRSIEMIWPNAKLVTIFHSQKQHGLTEEIMSKIFKEKDISLVIVPDAGSENYKNHLILKENGIDCIVIDHHEVPTRSTDAIIVNNQFPNEPNPNLSGAGMVYKFLEGLFEIKHKSSNIADFFLDMTASALVADIMCLNDLESRYILKQGFSNLINPLIRTALTNKGEVKQKMDFLDVGYNISPLINATIRVGTDEEKLNLFESILGHERIIKDVTTKVYKTKPNIVEDLTLQQYVIFNSKALKERQQSYVENEMSLLEQQIKQQQNYAIGVYVLSEEFPASVGGLLANKLASLTSKPAIVLKKYDNIYTGSVRAFDFHNLKDYMLDLDYTTFCSGHQSAFGVGFTEEGLLQFKMFLETNKELQKPQLIYKVDRIYDKATGATIDTLKEDILKISSFNDEWSNGFEEPHFAIILKEVTPDQISLMGKQKNTFKINSNGISFIKFRESAEKLEKLCTNTTKDITIIGTFDVNEWNGRTFPQVKIVDYDFKESSNEIFNPFAFII